MVRVDNVHGDICTDAYFGDMSWNESAGLFCYAAEASTSGKLDCFEYRGNWGEKLGNRIDPRLFLLDLNTLAIKQLSCKNNVAPASVRGDLYAIIN